MTFELLPHPASFSSVRTIDVQIWREGGRLYLRYLLEGSAKLVLPARADPGRADGLWRTTCFEAFVSSGSQAYREYNVSPSGQWATYAFDAPREGMRNSDDTAEVWLEGGHDWIALEAAFSGSFEPGAALGLSAVIEEDGGCKSYWALAHAEGPPDFHDPSCFIARVPE